MGRRVQAGRGTGGFLSLNTILQHCLDFSVTIRYLEKKKVVLAFQNWPVKKWSGQQNKYGHRVARNGESL